MKQKLFLLFTLTSLHLAYGQKDDLEETEVDLKENIHLHLNKTTFLDGERLWFKAYIQDQERKLPYTSTSNLHVGIYDANGNEVKRKLLYVENGMAQGDFAIDSTLLDTEYTVLAWTNYMRNFKELEPFRQGIKILRDGMEEEPQEVDMEISIYPEGGALIAGAYNNIGILGNNGSGQAVAVDDLELVDGTGNTIRSNITTNQFGMGKLGFMVEQGKSYYVQRQRLGLDMVKVRLPAAMTNLIGLNIENNGKDHVFLKLVASEETFKVADGNTYTLAIYQDGFVLLEDIKVNRQEPVISLRRDRLPKGVLTVSLFDSELNPIAYRMFFNHRVDEEAFNNLEVDYCSTKFGDSIQVDLILPEGIEQKVNVSLSMLPGFSMADNADNSIRSSFTLRPYIAQSFQDRYYFQEQDRKKRFELDKRLLIEGWGKYDWNSRELSQEKREFEVENGIEFSGKVMDADLSEEKQIYLVTELSSTMEFMALLDDKSFMGNMKLFEGDSLALSLIGKKGKLRKPEAELLFENKEKIKQVPEWVAKETSKRQPSRTNDHAVESFFDIGERTIALAEVTVSERAVRNNKYQLSAQVEGRVVGDVEINRYRSVKTYLQRLGFLIRVDEDGFGVKAIVPRYPFPVAPIIIDGIVASTGEVINMPLSSAQFITYSKATDSPFISISLNKNYIPPNRRNTYLKFAIENGYARPQEYFTPNYPDYSSAMYRRFGAIWWEGSIDLGSEIHVSITIPTKNQKNLKLYVEGMGETGALIAKSTTIELENLAQD